MDVTITALHCTIPDSVRDLTERRMSALERYGRRATSAAVSFSADHGQKACEARVGIAGGPPRIARATGPTFRAALDRAADRLERQLKRYQDRRRRHRGATPSTP